MKFKVKALKTIEDLDYAGKHDKIVWLQKNKRKC